MTEAAPPETRRKASRAIRRQQLIDATIGALARKGYAEMTIADVARAAGLSAGIVIFHFASKDELLASALRALSEEYFGNWSRALAEAGPSPKARLAALLLADFDAILFTPQKLAAWIAFWGESQGRPVYDQICGSYDKRRRDACLRCCADLIGNDGGDPNLIMLCLDALGDGLWLSMASAGSGLAGRITAEEAKLIMQSALAAHFPRVYPMPKPEGRTSESPFRTAKESL